MYSVKQEQGKLHLLKDGKMVLTMYNPAKTIIDRLSLDVEYLNDGKEKMPGLYVYPMFISDVIEECKHQTSND